MNVLSYSPARAYSACPKATVVNVTDSVAKDTSVTRMSSQTSTDSASRHVAMVTSVTRTPCAKEAAIRGGTSCTGPAPERQRRSPQLLHTTSQLYSIYFTM